jgi:TRAP-type C4-dicarboxylate transport system substrate-binding protein
VVALAISLMLRAATAFAQIKWSLPSAYPADNFHSQNLDAFAKDLAEATGGKLSIKVYSNASLLPVSVIKRAVQMGRMQIGCGKTRPDKANRKSSMPGTQQHGPKR